MSILIVPFLIQGLAMFFDEFYFHRRRGLPIWERVGHPLDTLSVLASFAFVLYSEPTQSNLYLYIALCTFSSLLVTKDEFIHAENCEGAEHWLHSVLFVLHPLSFISAGIIWFYKMVDLKFILSAQVAVILGFLFYQIIYWNIWTQKT